MSNFDQGSSYTPPPPPPTPPPAGGGGGDVIYPATPPKDPILVLILNLFLAGVGSIILGQKTKGIVAIVTWFIIAIPTCGAGSGLVAIVMAVDGYLQAQQLQQGRPVGQWTFFSDHR
ncbi:MAG TPA: hypothetical protein VGF28_20310 [Thermoanaerobaculia bacterium]|jgi:TM2 domain-containing membrane protein YozV